MLARRVHASVDPDKARRLKLPIRERRTTEIRHACFGASREIVQPDILVGMGSAHLIMWKLLSVMPGYRLRIPWNLDLHVPKDDDLNIIQKSQGISNVP